MAPQIRNLAGPADLQPWRTSHRLLAGRPKVLSAKGTGLVLVLQREGEGYKGGFGGNPERHGGSSGACAVCYRVLSCRLNVINARVLAAW